MVMTDKKNLLLKLSLIIFAIVAIVYGVGYLLFPDFLVKLSGGEPVFSGWLRWSGGTIVALGIGAFMIFQNPKGQGIFVTTLALGNLLAGLALVYSWITLEEEANVWFTALPAILVLLISALLWWSLSVSKDILKSDQK